MFECVESHFHSKKVLGCGQIWDSFNSVRVSSPRKCPRKVYASWWGDSPNRTNLFITQFSAQQRRLLFEQQQQVTEKMRTEKKVEKASKCLSLQDHLFLWIFSSGCWRAHLSLSLSLSVEQPEKRMAKFLPQITHQTARGDDEERERGEEIKSFGESSHFCRMTATMTTERH